jgi:hypothetical protein
MVFVKLPCVSALRKIAYSLTDPKQVAMLQRKLDINSSERIMTPDEVARFFKKSTSWVYKNWKKLGGVKLGGSLFFPSKEDLYEQLFQERKRVEVRFHPQGNQVHRDLVQNKKNGQAGRSKKKGGIKYATKSRACSDRHGLL